MPDGTEVVIDHLPVTQARETLGVWSSPAGNANESLVKMNKKAQEWVDQAKEGRLGQWDVCFLLDVQFWPRVGYGICCNMAKHAKLESALRKQYYQMIPLGGVVRTAPALIRQLHRGFYGIGCPHPGIKCLTSQLSKLLMHYGTKSSVGMEMAVSFRELILELGVSRFSHFWSCTIGMKRGSCGVGRQHCGRNATCMECVYKSWTPLYPYHGSVMAGWCFSLLG